MVRLLTPLLFLLAWLPAALHAEPLDARQLPSAAVWFVHLDADAARESSLGRQLREQWLAQPANAKALEQARQAFGIDLTRDIHGVTVYGTTYAPDAGILILRGRVDRTHLDALLKTLPGYRNETVSGYSLYFWNEAAPNRRHESIGAFFGNDTVVIAPDTQSIVTALQVLDGKSPALPGNSPLTVPPAAGTILQAAATGLAQAKGLPIQSPVIRQCESGSLAVGEQKGQVFVHGRVVTQSADTAAELRSLIEGAKAMGQLQASDNAELARLLGALRVTANSASVDIDWEFSSGELIKMVQSQQAKKAAATQPGNDK